MIQRSRVPAIVTLLTLLLLGGGLLLARRGVSADESQLAALQAAVAQPNAGAATWLQYGQKLQALAIHDHSRCAQAINAFRKVLELEPGNRQARFACSCCLAQDGDRDHFYDFMKDAIQVDPRLSKQVFERAEVAMYLTEDRFKALKEMAIAQSMD